MNLRRWLTPGIGVKRWLAVVFLGEFALALAGAFALRQVYREVEVTGPFQAGIYLVTLQFLPYWARATALVIAGLALFLYGSFRVVRALLGPFRKSADEPLVDVVYRKRLLARGPRVVAIGGGTGLSVLLRGLKERTANLTAIVSVADDGGSTGRLRDQTGIPAVGDIRNCLVALAETEPAMGELLQYRFGRDEGSLSGHAVGNLLITAMNAIDGDFEEAVRKMNRVLAVRGQVVPATGAALTLHARLRDGSEVEGQSRIMRMRGIERVWLEPRDARAARDALAAIGEADLIVLGPGSLFTSILAVVLVPELREAILAAPGIRVYAANVATQLGETEKMDLAEHVEALLAHAGSGMVDVVLANNRFEPGARDEEGGEPVRLRWPPAISGVPAGPAGPRLVLEELADPANPHHHDPGRLAAALVGIFEREGLRNRPPTIARSA